MRAKAPVPGSTRVSGLASAYSRRRATRSSRLACSGRENRGSRQYLSVCLPGSLRATATCSPTRTMDFWCAVWIERRTITGTS